MDEDVRMNQLMYYGHIQQMGNEILPKLIFPWTSIRKWPGIRSNLKWRNERKLYEKIMNKCEISED